MTSPITPHEPNELIVSSVDEAFADAEASEKRWQEWQSKHQLKPVSILLPEGEYTALANLATKQKKAAPQGRCYDL